MWLVILQKQRIHHRMQRNNNVLNLRYKQTWAAVQAKMHLLNIHIIILFIYQIENQLVELF